MSREFCIASHIVLYWIIAEFYVVGLIKLNNISLLLANSVQYCNIKCKVAKDGASKIISPAQAIQPRNNWSKKQPTFNFFSPKSCLFMYIQNKKGDEIPFTDINYSDIVSFYRILSDKQE